MRRAQRCLDRIADVRQAAYDLNSAYLLRTRTHRMLLSIQRLVAAEYGQEVLRPCVLTGTSSDPAMRELAALTNELLDSTRHLSQRSAAFDRQWQQEWDEVETMLGRLEQALQSLVHPPAGG
jgi:hypothetical protein